jgi:hypothetical protein
MHSLERAILPVLASMPYPKRDFSIILYINI